MKCIWEIPVEIEMKLRYYEARFLQELFSEMFMGNPMDYKEDKSHNSAAKLWHVRNASLKKLSI